MNPDLFSELEIPGDMNKDLLVNNILFELAEMSIIYSEPHTLQKLIGIWSKRRLFVWTELYKTLLYKYDPIANYDRTEERVYRDDYRQQSVQDHSHTNNGDWTQDYTHKNVGGWDQERTGKTDTDYAENSDTNRTPNLEEHTSESTSGKTVNVGNEDRKHKVWGFNSEVSADSFEDVIDNTNTTDTTTSSEGNRSNTGNEKTTVKLTGDSHVTLTENITNDHHDDDTDNTANVHTDTDTDKTTGGEDSINFHSEKMRARGNIGVTTTQQMIEQQRRLVEFDMYKYIIDDFKSQFCLMVY